MQRSSTRRYAGILAALLTFSAALLSGCADDSAQPAPLDAPSQTPDTPDPDPSTSADPTGAADPTGSPGTEESPGDEQSPSAPPTLPPEARGTTRASAGPFVRHWVDMYQHAVTRLAPEHLNELSLPGCEACNLIIGSLRKIERSGGHFEGSGWQLRRVQVLPQAAPRRMQVRAHLSFTPQKVYERADSEPIVYRGGERSVYTFNLASDTDTWVVAGIIGVTT